MSIPIFFADPEPGFDLSSQPVSGLWLSAMPLAVASLLLASLARRRELERRSSAGRALSTFARQSAVVAICVVAFPACVMVGAGL